MSYIDLTGKTVVVSQKNFTTARLTFDDGTVAWIEHGDLLPKFEQVPQPAEPTTKSDADVARENLREIAAGGHPVDRIAAARVLLTFGGGE